MVRAFRSSTAKRVFLPFQRLGDRDNETGVGLGLALSRGLTEAMGGTLRPDTTPGGGLTIVLALPASETAEPAREEGSAPLGDLAGAAGVPPPAQPGGCQMIRVLVVDDEPQILRALRINLRARGYDVEVAADGTQALRVAATQQPELVVLDLGLPDLDGLDVIHGLRGWTAVPIIVLSGRAGSSDKVAALDAGADDYVTKPFGVDELLARIRAVTRRTAGQASAAAAVTIGRWQIQIADRMVCSSEGTEQVRLTPTEWKLLEILVQNPGKLVSQRQLLQEVWGPQYGNETNYLRQYMAQLRHKLEDDPSHPRHLLTEPGMGYRLHLDDGEQPTESLMITGPQGPEPRQPGRPASRPPCAARSSVAPRVWRPSAETHRA